MINYKDLIFAIFILILFYLKIIIYPESLLVDDISDEFLPKLISISRALQNFELPLLNRFSFMGGNPFYLDLESPIYSLFLLPFYLLTGHQTILSSLYGLIILPFIFAGVIGYLGCIKLGVKYFKFSKWDAHAFALLFTTSSALYIDGLLYMPELVIYTLLPWAIFLLLREDKKLNISLLMVLVMINFSGSLKQLLRFYIFMFMIFVPLAFYSKKMSSLLCKLRAVFVSWLLASVLLIPQFEGVSLLIKGGVFDKLGNLEFYPLKSFLFLLSRFFYFILSAPQVEDLSGLVGGFDQLILPGSSMFMVLIIYFAMKYKDGSRTYALKVVMLFILLMIFWSLASFSFPIVSQVYSFPHPTYFRFIICFVFYLLMIVLLQYVRKGYLRGLILCLLLLESVGISQLFFLKTYNGLYTAFESKIKTVPENRVGALWPLDFKMSNYPLYRGKNTSIGYDARPLNLRTQKIFDIAQVGLPTQISSRPYFKNFMSNLRVSGFISSSPFEVSSDDIYYFFKQELNVFKPSYKLITENLTPDYFFQNQVFTALKEDELTLLTTDLKEKIFLFENIELERLPYSKVNRLNRLLLLSERESSISMEMDIKTPSVLVTPFIFDTAWRLSSSSKVSVIKVNNYWMGVFVSEPGVIKVKLRYLPTSFLIGFGVSCLTLMSLFICFWRRRGRSHAVS